MRIHPHQRISQDGGVLAVALMMCMIAGLFLTGWIALVGTRAIQARIGEDGARRRLMLESTRAYARQFCSERMFSGYSSVGAGLNGELDSGGVSGNGWGAFNTNTGWTGLQFYDLPVYNTPSTINYPSSGYYSTIFPFNAFGLRPGASFINTQALTRPNAYAPSSTDPSLKRLDNFAAYMFGKGIFPSLAGDAFVIYRKPETESGEIVIDSNFYIDGRLTIKDPASLFNSATVNLGTKIRIGARSTNFYVQKADAKNRVTGTSNGKFPATFMPSAGSEMMPINFPATPSTFGPFPRPGGTAPTTAELYRGELNIIKNDYVPAGLPASVTTHPNCLWQIQDREATKATSPVAVQTISVGTAVGTNTDPYWIEDQTSPTYPPPAWPAGYPPVWKVLFINLQHTNLTNLRIYGVVHQVVLLGQTTLTEYNNAASMSPRIILIVPDAASRAVQDIRFVRENNRPFVLGMKGDVRQPLGLYWAGPNVNSTALTLDWRLIMINEYRQIMCNLPSGGGGPDSVALYGGVLTNWSFERYDSGSADKFKILVDPFAGYDTSVTPNVYKLTSTSGYNLASILPRETWLEPFFKIDP